MGLIKWARIGFFGFASFLAVSGLSPLWALDAPPSQSREEIRRVLQEHAAHELERMGSTVPDEAQQLLSDIVQRGADVVFEAGATPELVAKAQANLTELLTGVVTQAAAEPSAHMVQMQTGAAAGTTISAETETTAATGQDTVSATTDTAAAGQVAVATSSSATTTGETTAEAAAAEDPEPPPAKPASSGARWVFIIQNYCPPPQLWPFCL
jgi:hypothetical protein